MEEEWRRSGGGVEEEWRRSGGNGGGGVGEEWGERGRRSGGGVGRGRSGEGEVLVINTEQQTTESCNSLAQGVFAL